MSVALTAAPPSPVVESCRDDRLLSAAAVSLSKHQVAATLATASPDGAPAAVAHRDGVAVLAPADFCAVGRVQQSRAAHDAAGARPERQRPEVRAHFRFDRIVCSNLANNAAGETTPLVAEQPSRRRGAGRPSCSDAAAPPRVVQLDQTTTLLSLARGW